MINLGGYSGPTGLWMAVVLGILMIAFCFVVGAPHVGEPPVKVEGVFCDCWYCNDSGSFS